MTGRRPGHRPAQRAGRWPGRRPVIRSPFFVKSSLCGIAKLHVSTCRAVRQVRNTLECVLWGRVGSEVANLDFRMRALECFGLGCVLVLGAAPTVCCHSRCLGNFPLSSGVTVRVCVCWLRVRGHSYRLGGIPKLVVGTADFLTYQLTNSSALA